MPERTVLGRAENELPKLRHVHLGGSSDPQLGFSAGVLRKKRKGFKSTKTLDSIEPASVSSSDAEDLPEFL